MIKKIIKGFLIFLLILALIPIIAFSLTAIKYRLSYSKSLEQPFVDRLKRYSSAVRAGGSFDFPEGYVEEDEYVSHMRLFFKINYEPANHRVVSFEELPEELVEMVTLSEQPDFFRRKGFYRYYFIGDFFRKLPKARPKSVTLEYIVSRMKIGLEPSFWNDLPARIFYSKYGQDSIRRNFSKKETLELLLNYYYFDFTIYGIENASHFYFGKTVSELNRAESALLVAQLRGGLNSPLRSSERCRFWQLNILKMLENEGKLAKGEAEREVELFWESYDPERLLTTEGDG